MRQTYGYKVIAQTLVAIDLVEFLIFICLALALVYTVFVTVRSFRRYFLARPESYFRASGPDAESQQSRKDLIAELARGVRTLKAIASGAPFLGLAGTAYGILALFSVGFIGERYPFVKTIPLEAATALVATAFGLIVAATAAVCCNILVLCLERIESKSSSTLLEGTSRSYGFAQTLPLRKRFAGMPAFALIGAPVLAILIPMYALIGPRTPLGLPVHLLRIGTILHDSDAIVVSLIGPDSDGVSTLHVNSKETPWSELGETLRRQLEVRPHWVVYVKAEDGVWWQHVVNVIDVARGLRAEVVLLSEKPRIDAGKVTRKKSGSRVRQTRKKAGKKLKGP